MPSHAQRRALVRRAALLALFCLLPTSAPTRAAPGVRDCLYQPGVSVPAPMPADLLGQARPTRPAPTLATTAVDAATVGSQLATFTGLWNAVRDHYVYADFRGRDWNAIGARYRALVERGLSGEHFKAAMQAMLAELGDEHSYFQTREDVARDEAEMAGRREFVGIGTLLQQLGGGERAAILALFPQGPAAQAGLRPHDGILRVDGGPVREPSGVSRTLGPEGSRVTLTVERPGEPSRELTLVRRRVGGGIPIDFCRVPGTRIGYLFLPTFLDQTIPEQTRGALRQLAADGPLEGLVLDNRMNGGGSGAVAEALLRLFTGGHRGDYVSRTDRKPLRLEPEDIGGSQSVPLVVLVDVDTVSYAEIFSGVLRVAGRARVVGTPTLGNALHRSERSRAGEGGGAASGARALAARARAWYAVGRGGDTMATRKTKSSASRASGTKARPAKSAARRRPAARAAVAAASSKQPRLRPETLRLRELSVALTVDDLARSMRFYTEALGFTVKQRWEREGKLMGVMLLAGDCELGLAQDDWAKGRDRKKGIGFRIYAGTTQNLEALAARIRAQGVEAVGPKKESWGARTVSVTDPDGFQITIHSEA